MGTRVYRQEQLKDLPRPKEFEYKDLTDGQLEWCINIESDPKANSGELGNKVLLATRISHFPEEIAVFVSDSTDLANNRTFPDRAPWGAKDSASVVYIKVPVTVDKPPATEALRVHEPDEETTPVLGIETEAKNTEDNEQD